MLFDLLLAPVTGPFTGVTWIARQIQERAETEVDNKENLSKQLLALQLAFDMGDISEEEFEVQEEELLLEIQAMEEHEREAVAQELEENEDHD